MSGNKNDAGHPEETINKKFATEGAFKSKSEIHYLYPTGGKVQIHDTSSEVTTTDIPINATGLTRSDAIVLHVP